MSNSIAYTIPIIGQTPDPTWESDFNAAFTAIQTHTHDGINAGALLQPGAISFATTGFNFGGQPQTNAAYYEVAQQASLPAQTSGRGRLVCDTSGNLYYVSPSANVLLASASAINYSSAAKGFLGNYGSTGGAAYYNTSSGSWPYASTFYLYTSTSTPSNDTGTRASVAAANVYIKGASGAGSSSTAGSVFYTDTAVGASTEVPAVGLFAVSSGSEETGISVIRASATGSYCPALIVRETDNSKSNLSNTAGGANARTYGLHINGSSAGGTANGAYHFTLRANIPNGTNSNIADISYWTRNCTDSTGAGVAPANGFGYRHRWHLQTNTSLGQGTVAAVDVVQWQNVSTLAGQYTLSPAYGGSITSNPGLDMLATSSSAVAVGINTSASAGTPLSVGGALVASGLVSGGSISTGGTLLATGAATFQSTASVGSNLSVTGNATIGGTLAVTGNVTAALTSASTITATTFFPSATATQPTSSKGGLFLNNQILAYGHVDAAGVVTNSFNVASASWGSTGVCTVGLSISLSSNVIGMAVLDAAAASSGKCQIAATGATCTIYTQNSSGSAANEIFQFMVVGQP